MKPLPAARAVGRPLLGQLSDASRRPALPGQTRPQRQEPANLVGGAQGDQESRDHAPEPNCTPRAFDTGLEGALGVRATVQPAGTLEDGAPRRHLHRRHAPQRHDDLRRGTGVRNGQNGFGRLSAPPQVPGSLSRSSRITRSASAVSRCTPSISCHEKSSMALTASATSDRVTCSRSPATPVPLTFAADPCPTFRRILSGAETLLRRKGGLSGRAHLSRPPDRRQEDSRRQYSTRTSPRLSLEGVGRHLGKCRRPDMEPVRPCVDGRWRRRDLIVELRRPTASTKLAETPLAG